MIEADSLIVIDVGPTHVFFKIVDGRTGEEWPISHKLLHTM